jgi:hypothetical protein
MAIKKKCRQRGFASRCDGYDRAAMRLLLVIDEWIHPEDATRTPLFREGTDEERKPSKLASREFELLNSPQHRNQ